MPMGVLSVVISLVSASLTADPTHLVGALASADAECPCGCDTRDVMVRMMALNR